MASADTAARPAAEHGEDSIMAGYGPAERRRRLGPYGVLLAIYNSGLVALLTALARRGRLPERVEPLDLVTVGIATHKLTRIVAKDKVTSPLRAPFVEFQGEGPPGEVEEAARGSGARRVFGELISCPYCLAQWFATAFLGGLALFPRPTRFLSGLFSVTAIADFLHLVYRGADEKLRSR
ncbi:MAG: hypothetical protein QOJ38_55 [Solirubrobacterales bacterium]|jgi:hypothetical protein|nr:hypothetical protein [Solirubrobacterales bacterium]